LPDGDEPLVLVLGDELVDEFADPYLIEDSRYQAEVLNGCRVVSRYQPASMADGYSLGSNRGGGKSA